MLDRLLAPFMVGFLGIAFAVWEWLRYWLNVEVTAFTAALASVLAVVAVGYAVWRIVKFLPEARWLNLGLQGEVAVGQCLDQLRGAGYHVFHDIPGDGWNVDHVVIGPGGVFAIETKTRSKPRRGQSEVAFDGETVRVNGYAPDRDALAQVRASARQVKEIIEQTAGLDHYVRPVIIFPGWYTRTKAKSEVWVLNDTAFPKWVVNEAPRLDPDKVQRIAAGLAMYLRCSGKP
jgi:hypothetical protein